MINRDMSPWRSNPRTDLVSPFRFNRFLEDFFEPSLLPTPLTNNEFPSADVEETESHFLVSMDMPGLDRKDIQIQLIGNQLVVTGERQTQDQHKNRQMRITERSHRSYSRSLTLPSDVNAEDVQANYHNGVLELAIPKAKTSKVKQIEVKEEKSLLSKLFGRSDKEKQNETDTKH